MLKVKIKIEELDAYMHHVHSDDFPKKSLNEFIHNIRPELKDSELIADLTSIDFEKNKFNLCDGDFSGTILDGINFSGKNIVLKGANLEGASLKGTKFTDSIDLENVNFGSIEIHSEVFENCQLSKAKYDPVNSKIALIKPTKGQLNNYFALKLPKPNLNKYLKDIIGYQYPDLTIVADLSGMVINSEFNNADISNSRLDNTTITGEITNLQLRDCYTHNTNFKNCHLIEPDMRGTCLADEGEYLAQSFKAANFEGQVKLTSPKLSIGANLALAQNKGLLPMENGAMAFLVEGEPLFDPCYNKKNIKIKKIYIKISREAVIKYCNFIHKDMNKGNYREESPSFHEYMKMKENEVADLSELDFRNIDFSRTKFNNCDFSFCDLSGSKFDNAVVTNSNFSGVNMSNRLFNLQFKYLAKLEDRFLSSYKTTSMQKAIFNDCNFTWADVTNVNANGAELNNIIGINLSAENFKLGDEAQAYKANFNGSVMNNIKAPGLKAEDSSFMGVLCNEGDFQRSNISYSNFANSNFDNSKFNESKLNSSNFFQSSLRSVDLNGSSIKHARLDADISLANIRNVCMTHAEVSKIHYDKSKIPNIDNIMGEPLLNERSFDLKDIDISKKDNLNKQLIYNKWSVLVVVTTVTITLAIPLTIAFVAPALISSATMNAMILSSVATVSAVTMDALSGAVFGCGIGANKVIANYLGAEKAIEINNAELKEAQKKQNNFRNKLSSERINLLKNEKEITRESKNRYNNSIAPKRSKQNFYERVLNNQHSSSLGLNASKK